jgi:hypothetical protein
MASFIELDCVCGATVRVPETAFGSAEGASCRRCGAEFLFETGDAASSGGDFSPEGAGVGRGGPSCGNDPCIADPALQCPTCGGQTEVVYCGPGGRDRMLACPYCRTEVDLPEVRGRTHERVTERPDEKIVERVTQWEGMEPELEGDAAFARWDGAPDGTVEFELNGLTFDSRDDFERHLRDLLPEGVAQNVFAELDQNVTAPKSGAGSRTRVYEYSSVKTEQREDDVFETEDHPIPADTLAKIRKLFKRKA